MNRKFVEEKLKGKVSDEDLKELVDVIIDEHGKGVEDLKKQLETSQNDLKIANQKITNLTNDVKDRDTQLENLRNSSDDVESLKSQIATLQADNASKEEEHVKEINALKLEHAIESALTNAKSKNNIAVRALLKLDDLSLQEDGSVKGLLEQLEKLKGSEDTKFLFNEETKIFKGAIPGESGNEELDGKVDLSSMNYDERAAYLEEHPEIDV